MQIPLKQYSALLTHYLAPQRGRVFGLMIALLGSIGLQILNPQILGYFIDTAVSGGSQQQLMIAALLFIGLALLTRILIVIATYLGETVAWLATNALRFDLARHCLSLDLSFHKLHTPGELLERVDGDVNLLSRFFSQLVIHVFGNGILLLGILIILFVENPLAGISLTLFSVMALSLLLGLQSFAIAVIQEAGLSLPLALSRYTSQTWSLSKERLNELESDAMFLRAWGGIASEQQAAQAALQKLKADPLWRQLQVVQQGKVYEVGDYFQGGGPITANLILDDLFRYLLSAKS
jgi:ABC-type multidrug transport system fused ATPase/permease subunit